MLSDGSLVLKCSASLAVCNEKIITTLYMKMLFTHSHFGCMYMYYFIEECYVRKVFITFAIIDVVMSSSHMSYNHENYHVHLYT